jgi:hypothetical protein
VRVVLLLQIVQPGFQQSKHDRIERSTSRVRARAGTNISTIPTATRTQLRVATGTFSVNRLSAPRHRTDITIGVRTTRSTTTLLGQQNDNVRTIENLNFAVH